MSDDQTPNSPVDHGVIVHKPRLRISWVWVFPIIAALATGWLFWTNWKSNGPEIEIVFDTAPGMQAGKTPLIYRGVTAGVVTGLRLDSGLHRVILTVRLKEFAADLAREGTVFWIDQPVVGIGETSGLDALIQGNYLQARIGSGSPTRQFFGVNQAPLTPLEAPSLVLRLRALNIPLLDRGSPLFFRGMQVGMVESKELDENGEPFIQIVIEQKFAGTVRSNTRFWTVPGTSVKIGGGGVKLEMLGLKSILLGGVEFDTFGKPGEPANDSTEFTLSPDRLAAQATGSPVRIVFKDGQGIEAGQTQIRHLGVPVGFVESAKLNEATRTVDTVVRFNAEFEHLHTAGTLFTLIRPQISLNGVSGLETLISGVYIDCAPGLGTELASDFQGRSISDQRLTESLAEREGIQVTLEAKNLPPLNPGAPLLYRGLIAGRIKAKQIGANGDPYFVMVIRKDFVKNVSQNTRFWQVPSVAVEAGPGVMKMEIAGLETLIQGGVAFDTFGAAEAPAETGAKFQLYPTESIARAISPAIRVAFENGQGLLAGQTQVRYLGLPVGLVESVTSQSGKVEAVLRLNEGYDFLRREGSAFSIVRLNVSLNGVTGLETVVSGVYIECVPASGGKLIENFTGVSLAKAEFEAEEESGFEVIVTTSRTNISVDAPIFYRGIIVGKVGRKILSGDGQKVGLAVIIKPTYANLIRENTKFWDAGGMKVSMGFFSLKVQSASLDALARGAIAFATPNNANMGPRVKRGHEFELSAGPRPEWLRWAPNLPNSN